jgi:large subunit ribosomal protein L25
MAESVELTAQPRPQEGSHYSRKLRRKGFVPAVVYGHKEAAVSIVLPRVDLEKALRHGHRVVDLNTDGKLEKALVREVQWDHLGNSLLHVDFSRIAADERVVVTVPLEIKGLAPGVVAGGVLEQPIHAVSVECLAVSVPESIRVSVAELQIGGIIHIRDLVLPAGAVTTMDPELVVVHVVTPTDEVEPAGPEGGAAEPEVIGRKAAEGETAEE